MYLGYGKDEKFSSTFINYRSEPSIVPTDFWVRKKKWELGGGSVIRFIQTV